MSLTRLNWSYVVARKIGDGGLTHMSKDSKKTPGSYLFDILCGVPCLLETLSRGPVFVFLVARH